MENISKFVKKQTKPNVRLNERKPEFRGIGSNFNLN